MVFKNVIVCFLWTVLSWANSSRNLVLPLKSNGQVLGIVAEVAMLFVGPWSICGIVNDFFATMVKKFCSSMVFKNVIVCLFWTVISWANGSGNLVLPLQSNSHVFGIMTEVAMLFVRARSVGWIVNDFFATKVEKLSSSVILKHLLVSVFW